MNSLRLRAALGAVVWITLALAMGGAAIWAVFTDAMARQFDSRIEERLEKLAVAIAVTDRAADSIEARMADSLFQRPFSGLYWRAEGPAETLRSRSLWDSDLALPPDPPPGGAIGRLAVEGPDGRRLRVLERVVRTPRDGAWRVSVAADRTAFDAEQGRLARALIVSLGVLVVLLTAAAAAQIALALRPLGRLRRALADHRAGRTQRVEGAFPSEVAPLAADLNRMLERNEKLTAQARRRASDLAHALKTPAAVLRNELNALSEDLGPARIAAAQEALERIESQSRRQLARARIALTGPGARADVGLAIDRLSRALRRVYAHRGLTIERATAPGALFRGDPQDLEELLGNLMDNACKWAESRVRVTAATPNDGLTLSVEDDGPGMPDSASDDAIKPGVRLDQRREGHGLGLAIVADIVEAYKAELAFSPSPLGGLKVSLRFEAGDG